MHLFKKIIFLLGLVILFPTTAMAANYSLVSGAACGSGSTCPACSGGSWSVSGANFTCSGSISLASGDAITASATANITASSSITLNNNTIGSASQNINLTSSSSTITTTNGPNVFGSLTANGNINLTGGSVTGSVTSSCCTVTTNGTAIGGAITANGAINLTGGSVGGLVKTTGGAITSTANLSGGAQASSGITINGGTIAGAFNPGGNTMNITNATMTSGSISNAGTVNISNSTLGSSSNSIVITAVNGAISLTNSSTVYGALTAPSWSTVNVAVGSVVIGSCSPNSTPANSCNATPVLLGSWRMDEISWNGTAGEIKDSSGQGNHGRARIANGSTALPSTASGSPAYTFGSQSTCRYGTFDSTTPTIRTYTYAELSGFPVLPNGFTFAAWIRSTNASAQHQRILVRDDADNGWGLSLADGTGLPKLRFFARNITNNGAVTGQGTDPACGVFCVDTNAVLTSNAWYYVASVINTAAKTVTLYVYNASGTLQAKATGAYSGTWTDGTGTAAIGGETSASSEGTQTSWHFLGNIDEVNIYSGALTQVSIESLLTTVRTCPATLNNYGISHSGTGITCAAEPITISAYDSVGALVAPTAGTQITLSTAPATGVWSGGATYSFTGTETSVVKYLQQTTASTLNINVTDGSKSESASLDPSITFFDSGIKFYENTASPSYGINNQVAGVADNNLKLKVLRTDNNTGACVARVTGNKSVNLAAVCRNPTTCVVGQTFIVNAPPSIALNANANLVTPTYTTLTLNFDGTGTASLPINYSDVGQMQLVAQMSLAAAGNDPAVTFTQNSNDFVVKPYSLQISSVLTTSGGANPGGTSALGAAAGFVSAGTPFQVKVQSINFSNAVTPNFGNETVSEKNKLNLVLGSLVYPSAGNSTAITGAGNNSFSATTPAGTFVNNSVVWNQVGSITLVPLLSGGNYLGAGDVSVVPAASATIGRFYPDHYRLVNSTVTNSCSSFSYMSQPAVGLSYLLQAETLGGGVATNYGGNYATGFSLATPNYVAENLDGANGASLSSRIAVGATVWSGGQLNFSTSSASFSREILNGTPDGPYISLQLGMNLVDNFDVRSLQALDMKSTTSGSCTGSCTEKMLGSSLNLVYGRLKIDDAFGPETVSLPVNFVTEYWMGNNFSRNGLDSCTIIPRAAVLYPAGNLSNDANRTVSVGGGSTQGIYTNLDAAGIHFGAGTAGNYFTAPGAGNTATAFLVQIDLTNFSWLRYDWNQDGIYSDIKLPDPDTTKVPNAKIGFGSYRGNDRIIYWREKLQ